MNNQNTNKISNTEYDALISNTFKDKNIKKNNHYWKIISIENDIVTIDVLKVKELAL